MYTWGYLKNSTLAKLDLEEDEAIELNLLNRFVYYANEAITQICSAVKSKLEYCEFVVDKSKVGSLFVMPDDFVSFSNEVCTRTYDDYNAIFTEEIHDDCINYRGYNKVSFNQEGKYNVSYNARWIVFNENMPDDYLLDVPTDILDSIPSYIASQCYKIDDEYKSSVYRNEYEMFIARIDNTNFSDNKTIKIEGDW